MHTRRRGGREPKRTIRQNPYARIFYPCLTQYVFDKPQCLRGDIAAFDPGAACVKHNDCECTRWSDKFMQQNRGDNSHGRQKNQDD